MDKLLYVGKYSEQHDVIVLQRKYKWRQKFEKNDLKYDLIYTWDYRWITEKS